MPFAASVSSICAANPASAPASKLKATILRLASPFQITRAGLPAGGSVTGGAGGVGGTGVGGSGEGAAVSVAVSRGVGLSLIVEDGDGATDEVIDSDAPVPPPQPAASMMRMPVIASL